MGERIHKEHRPNEDRVAEAVGSPAVASQVSEETAERHEKLTEDVDALLDEIDTVLEPNAQDFVRAFVQKGGE